MAIVKRFHFLPRRVGRCNRVADKKDGGRLLAKRRKFFNLPGHSGNSAAASQAALLERPTTCRRSIFKSISGGGSNTLNLDLRPHLCFSGRGRWSQRQRVT